MSARPPSTALLGAVAGVLLAGCTSISWQDDAGVVHHAGLVWGRVDQLVRGQRLAVTSVGLDLRLNGPDAGYSIGWKSQELIAPTRRRVASAELGDAVFAELSQPAAAAGERGDWRLFWFSERVSAQTTLATGYCAGLELRTGAFAPGLSLGWHRGWQLVGDALDQDVVHVHWLEPWTQGTDSATLWTLVENAEGGASRAPR